ncbi:cytochrome C oxidase subunit IV family protein [Sulfurospirillum arcachonense]|uniref:cytochrome C oxidase subunit IV family protein n=1 Tax=Sulfurospirillum arcachonense TaxID=57666 RepID=UPI000468C9B5|nr:cytochrome C oxidase subunit IV family protein [Sulfurospirillum arcachonense]
MNTNSNQELHPVKSSVYINVFYLLIGLTILTLAQPMVIDLDLGSTLIVQLGIAFTKAILIVAYYMHIKSSSSLFKKLIYTTVVLWIVLYTLMAIDTYYRYTPNDLFR